MTLKDVLDAIVTAVQADTTLSAYCQAQFGTDVTIFRGINAEDPPRDVDSPVVVITTGGRGRTPDMHRYTHRVQVGVGIIGGQPTVTDNVVAYPGVDQVNDLAVLVERATTMALLESGVVSDQPMDEEDQILFPWHLACWSYQVEIGNILTS